MRLAVRDAWLQMLRSGEHEQSRNFLQRGEGFCCLGVLCLAMEKVDGSPVVERQCGRLRGGYLQDQGRAYVELGSDAMFRLVRMNDDERKTFKEIADWIEENVPITSGEAV